MVAGLDFVTAVNKIFYTRSRRNDFNYAPVFESEITVKTWKKILGQPMKKFAGAGVVRN